MRIRLTGPALAVLVFGGSQGRSADLTPQEVEARAVRARQQIQSAHIVALIRRDEAIDSPQHRRLIHHRLEVWSSPAGHRLERTPAAGEKFTQAGFTSELICRGCGPDGAYVTYQPPRISVNIYARDDKNAAKLWDSNLSDPRKLGYSWYGFYQTKSIDQVVGAAGMQYRSAERVVFKGDEAILVRGVNPARNTRHACWIIPGKGYNVARVEVSMPPVPGRPDTPQSYIESELVLDAPSEVWYPRRYVCRNYDGDQLLNDEQVEVEVAEFNRVSPDVFRLAALNLPVGEPVYDNRTHRELYWTGKELSKTPVRPGGRTEIVLPAADPTPAEPGSSGSRDRWLTGAVSVALALAAVALLRRALFRSS